MDFGKKGELIAVNPLTPRQQNALKPQYVGHIQIQHPYIW